MPTFTIALENVLTWPGTFYFALLTTTLFHFSPHNRVAFRLCQEKTCILLKI